VAAAFINFDAQEHVAECDAVAFFDENRPNDAIFQCANLMLHLHRKEHSKQCASCYSFAEPNA
jgi:hypothetical protein